MDISSVNSDLIRGNVTTIILNSLADGDRYGYDILKEIEEKSEGRYKLKQATLYSCLKRLEKTGLISSYAGDPEITGGGQRRYYRLTEEGKNYLNKEKNEYEYSRTILDKLVSKDEFDFETRTAPFNADELRPYTKQKEEKKVVYKEKIVYKYLDPAQSGMCIIPQNDGAYLSDKEISFLEESAIKNPSKIYIDETKNADTDCNKIETAESNNSIEQPSIEQTLSDADKIATQSQENEFYNVAADTVTVETTNNNIFNESIDKDISGTKTEQVSVAIEDVSQSAQGLNGNEQSINQTAAQDNEQFDTRIAFFGNTFDERLDNMIKARKEAALLNSQNSQNEELPARGGMLKIFSVIDDAEGRHFAELRNNPQKQENEVLVSEARNRTLKEVLEEKERAAKERQLQNKSQTVEDSNQEEKDYATSFVTPKLEGNFEFEKSDAPYVDFFDGLTTSEINQPPEKVDIDRPVYQDAVLQNRLYSKGFNLKPYDKSESQQYYYGNFVYVNKLRRDSNILSLATYLVLLAILWSTCFKIVHQNLFIAAVALGVGLYLIPLITYFVKPNKRVSPKFNFRYAMLNAAMLFLELSVIVLLIGFFIVGADVNDPKSVIEPIVVPITLLTTLLFMPIYHGLLFNSKKYHVQ
ncbi:MAG: PadR family transcriptional regulator [Christensenellales bacterium]